MDQCELCSTLGGTLLWDAPLCRVVRIDAPQQPGFCRVIWKSHVREMTDLPAAQQLWLLQVVLQVEQVVRQLFSPDKINLASFGNMTPHLHWHIIPRWRDDPHFPEPIWGQRQRPDATHPRPVISDHVLASALLAALNHLPDAP